MKCFSCKKDMQSAGGVPMVARNNRHYHMHTCKHCHSKRCMFVAGPAGAQGRPYRRAMGHPKASAHVKRYKGKGVYAAGGGRLRGAKGGRRRGGNVRGGAVSLGAEPRIVGRPAARMAILRPGYGGHVQKVVPQQGAGFLDDLFGGGVKKRGRPQKGKGIGDLLGLFL